MRAISLCRSWRSGFTLAEAMLAVVIVSIACSAMLFTAAQSIQACAAGADSSRANLLAQDLMNEISANRWADPASPAHWGPENGETSTPTRAAFNDLDDYAGWSGPPQTRDGQDYDTLQKRLFPNVRSHEFAQYTCSVRVSYVTAAGQELTAGTTSPFRRVTVEVTRQGESPHKLEHIFHDSARLLGSTYWFNTNAQEPVATVQVVP